MRTGIGHSGFTIGELLTVIAIWTVAVSGTVPIASVLLNQHRMVSATRQLAFEITRARMQAVGQNTFVRIALVGPDLYARETSSDGISYARDGAAVSLPPDMTIVAGPTGTPRFDRQGLAPASTTLLLSGPAGQRTVSVNVLGRVTTG